MIHTLRYRTIYRSIHPPEADFLSNELLSCSRQVASYRQEADRMISELSASWSGNQRDIFLASLSLVPARLTYLVEMFRNQGDFFRTIQVTVEETVPSETQ